MIWDLYLPEMHIFQFATMSCAVVFVAIIIKLDFYLIIAAHMCNIWAKVNCVYGYFIFIQLYLCRLYLITFTYSRLTQL